MSGLVVAALVVLAAVAWLARQWRHAERLRSNLTTELTRAHDELRAERELRRILIEESPSALLVLDERGRVRLCNQAGRSLFLRDAPVEGASLATMVLQAAEPMRQALGADQDTLVAVDDRGESEMVQVSKRAVLEGEHWRGSTVLCAHPLTVEVHREEVVAYRRLVRVLSHELNNSLAPVASLSSTGRRLLEQGALDELPEVWATIAERVEHLRRFLQSYAAVGQLPRPHPRLSSVAGMLERMAQLYPGLHVVATEGAAWLDKEQAEQILVNLIQNALEAGSPLSEVSIQGEVRLDGSSRWEVSDRGRGFSDEALESALVPFFSTKTNGSGLGLSLCREIVDAHGGRLRLRNRDGGGAVVILRFPGSGRAEGKALSWTLGDPPPPVRTERA